MIAVEVSEAVAAVPDWIVIAGAVVAALGVIWRKAIKPIVDGVEYIKHEMSFDSGTTTRDAIKRIDGEVTGMKSSMQHMTRRLDTLEVGQQEILDEMEDDQ